MKGRNGGKALFRKDQLVTPLSPLITNTTEMFMILTAFLDPLNLNPLLIPVRTSAVSWNAADHLTSQKGSSSLKAWDKMSS